MTPEIKAAIQAHAEAEFPRECCGLVSVRKGRLRYTPCRNIAAAHDEFVMHPADYAQVADDGTITAVVHSHCYAPPLPSEADRVGCESSGLPWIIYALPTHQVYEFEPCGYRAPLVGRSFHHGVLDCFSLVRDYYRDTCQIEVPDFKRSNEWWLHGETLYLDNFAAAGFGQVPASDMQLHDVMLMQFASPTPHHAAVYIGGGVILQHLAGRLSSQDVYGGWFQKVTTHVLRHTSLC
ncbi:C40 family peptidase [Sulfuriferula sp.]|uniref:C40 family peptidase n=1 Tax=Sulfuriferula sp. TaxID=2025307 RepID=UPI0027309BD7|nr:C40 family peptidase [Sulfuriferula sp.]MDP2026455.1 C40 family peptidase [Sulfuriferula sp.]